MLSFDPTYYLSCSTLFDSEGRRTLYELARAVHANAKPILGDNVFLRVEDMGTHWFIHVVAGAGGDDDYTVAVSSTDTVPDYLDNTIYGDDQTEAGGASTGNGWLLWTVVDPGADEKYALTHEGPRATAETITIAGGSGLGGSGTITRDAKGHVNVSTKTITITHAGPGAEATTFDVTGDTWIVVDATFDGTIGFDANGHKTSFADLALTHGVPGSTDRTITITANRGFGTTGTNTLGIDAKGHVGDPAAGGGRTITIQPPSGSTNNQVLVWKSATSTWEADWVRAH